MNLFTPPVPLCTGSPVLDALFARHYLTTGRVLHLCGGTTNLQTQMLLGFCKGATDRGETSVYFDIDGALSPTIIEDAGLAPHFNASTPDDLDAAFRVLSPQTPTALDDALEALTALAVAPSVVVVGGLQLALENRFGAGARGKQLTKAGRVVHALIGKYRLLCADSNLTLVLAHSPDPATPDACPPPLERTIRGTMFAHCGFGLQLGAAWPDDAGANHIQAAVKLWNLNTRCGSAVTLKLCGKGRFKN